MRCLQCEWHHYNVEEWKDRRFVRGRARPLRLQLRLRLHPRLQLRLRLPLQQRLRLQLRCAADGEVVTVAWHHS